MKDARIYIGEVPRIVNAQQFVWVRDEHPKVDLRCTCIECGEAAFLNDEKGAKGVRLVNLEVTGRKKHMHRQGAGFSHYRGNAGKTCPLYFANNDPRFMSIRENNAFDVLEKQRNLSTLDKPRMREAIADVQRYLLQRLTGEKEISDDDKKSLSKIEGKVSSMIGLSDHPWALIYISALLIGSRERELKGKKMRLEYRGVGEQRLLITGLDGKERLLCLPEKIQLCRSRKNGKPPVPLWNDGPIEFKVSRGAARKIVSVAWHAAAKRLLESMKQQPEFPGLNPVESQDAQFRPTLGGGRG